ncbi:hypothetical protein QJS83_15645 [Bdellovibrio sp. 22V]|uniref:hypothetical protein n=1 Tax=Bdellovibrio TaxID=958 RepID=UPI002543164B|nr:hypothetical protein [Bdellovibrio sp. 22V]WII71897.1 hypothetical protein QJS83_15645 [Bdellovibrio sp. 22V]
MRYLLIVSSLLVSLSVFAKTDPSHLNATSTLGELPAPVIDERDLDALVEYFNEFLAADRKYRADMEPIFKNIRRELAKLKEKGLLKMEFDPRRLTNEELAEKIHKMATYEKVAGPSILVKTIHVGFVCTGLLTGKCGRLPEIQRPAPAPIIMSTGTK